jgi:multiple antibiotic resistance protein
MAWNQFVGITMLLYALTNPVGAVPFFLAMTRKVESVQIHRIIILAAAAVAVFFMGSALLGKQILNFFNVGLDDFRIAGGLLALMIAFEMFQAQYGRFIQVADETARDEVDIHGLSDHTLCFSAACGAGRAEHHDHSVQRQSRMASQSTACNCFAARSAPNGLTLWMAAAIERLLGRTGINVMTRVMALIVAAIGVNFIMTGIRSELPGLAAQ